jgi:hypothetical protein
MGLIILKTGRSDHPAEPAAVAAGSAGKFMVQAFFKGLNDE